MILDTLIPARCWGSENSRDGKEELQGRVTYLPIGEGTNLYLATVIDLCSRKLAGWQIADYIASDPMLFAPDGEGWWDVPVAKVSTMRSTQDARSRYEQERTAQRPLLG